MSLITQTSEAISLESLIDERTFPTNAKLIEFADLPPDCVAYNPSKVFYDNGEALIMVRVELRKDELSSETWVYRYQDEYDEKLNRNGDLVLPWQDPFAAHVQGKLITGGVRVFRNPNNLAELESFCTEMMIGDTLDDQELLCRIWGMKDVRPVDMSTNYRKRMGIYGRPQNGHATGDISYAEVETPYHLTEAIVKQAQVITKGKFKDGIWCGANDALHLSNGHNLVGGHVGRYNPYNSLKKEYRGLLFIHDPITNEIYDLKIGPSKSDFPGDFEDIYFTGGFHEEPDAPTMIPRHRNIENLRLVLTGGVGDAAVSNCVMIMSAAAA